MRGKLPNKPHDVPSRAMELLGQQPERRPRTSLAAREVGQVSVELLCLFGDCRTFFKPLRHPYTMKKAVRVDESEAPGSILFFVGPCCSDLIRKSRRHIDSWLLPIVTLICDTRDILHCFRTTYVKQIPQAIEASIHHEKAVRIDEFAARSGGG
jgi:hypothetical protein